MPRKVQPIASRAINLLMRVPLPTPEGPTTTSGLTVPPDGAAPSILFEVPQPSLPAD